MIYILVGLGILVGLACIDNELRTRRGLSLLQAVSLTACKLAEWARKSTRWSVKKMTTLVRR